MARLAGLKTKLSKHNVDERIAREIIGNGDLVDVTIRMGKMLNPETVCEILDASACGTSKRELDGIKEIEAETLKKKIGGLAHLQDFHSEWDVSLNDDGTLTGGWAIGEKGAFACVCSAPVDKQTKVSDLVRENRKMPLTYCLCCAGHCRQHLERLLGVRLKSREVLSSPINSDGHKPCLFLFDIA